MTTMKNLLAHTNSSPCFGPVRTGTPLKPALSSMQPGLPKFASSSFSPKYRTKKHVRFASTLEAVGENSSLSPDHDNPFVSRVKTNKRVSDPWREDGPLYGAYVEYLEGQDVLTSEISQSNRPSTPEPKSESSTYTHTFLIQSKSPEIVVDSITVSTPTRHFPRLLQRTKPLKNTNRKPSIPLVDPLLKQQLYSTTPPHHSQSRKIFNPVNLKNPPIKRTDLALPSIKTFNTNEKILRIEQPIPTKFVNEYLQAKKFTEILTNPLPGNNNQINYISGHAILPNFSKISQLSCHDQINSEPFFFQNHDHIQPTIH